METKHDELPMLAAANTSVTRAEKRLREAHQLKTLLSYLPKEVLSLDGEAMLGYGSETIVSIHFSKSDLAYAALHDAGFEFEAKPQFQRWSQTFNKVGVLWIDVPANGKVKYQATVGITKPPSCEIVMETEIEPEHEVTTFKAICADSGEEL